MQRKAIFPGSFDPFTIGHESVVRRSFSLFDHIVVAIGHNATKSGFFSLEQRMEWISSVFEDEPKVSVTSFTGLTVDMCKRENAAYILRGLRTSADFEYERAIAQINKAMYPEIESVFLLTMPDHTMVNSTIVRDIIRNGGDASKFVPEKMKISL